MLTMIGVMVLVLIGFGVASLFVAVWTMKSPTWTKAVVFSVMALICLVLFAHIRLWWLAATCRAQHFEALGREIPYAWHDEQQGDTVTVPKSADYHVYNEYPYYYSLHLMSGHELPSSAMSRGNYVIGYFEASPDYPWWYLVDILELRNSEILVLDESYAVHAEPREWLQGRSDSIEATTQRDRD